MIYLLKPHHYEHFLEHGIKLPTGGFLSISDEEYNRHYADWHATFPKASKDEIHTRILAHAQTARQHKEHPQNHRLELRIIALLILLLLILLFSTRAHAQFSHVNTITVTDGTTTLFTAAPFTITFSGCTVGGTGSAWTISCSGGPGGSGTVTSVSDLAPLFTTATRTTTPAFSLTNSAAHTVFGNNTAGAATPAYFVPACADISNAGAFCSGTAYSSLTGTPTLPATLANVAHKWLNSYTSGTGLFTQTQPDYSDLTGTPVLPANTTATASNFFTAYNSATGAFTKAQPAFTDISGTGSCAQEPPLTGDVTTSGCAATIATTIPNAHTFSGNINAFAGQNQIDAYYLNGVHVVEGIHYPFTNTGLQSAITDCVNDAGCNEVFVAAGATIHLTTCLSGFNNQIYIHSDGYAGSTLVLDSDIDGFCPASLTQNLHIANFQILTNTGVTLTTNHAAVHLLNAPRAIVENMLISTEATAGGCLLIENTGPAGNAGFGMWSGVFRNVTCQRITANQGTADSALGHFGIYCKGLSSGTNPDCSMNTFENIWVENMGVGMQFDFANSNTVTRAHLLLNSINFKCVSCKDNTIIARLNQFRASGSPVAGTNEHYNFDAGSSDNILFWKLESPSTKGTDSGTRDNLLLGATDAWNLNTLRVLSGSAGGPTYAFQAFPTYGMFMDTSNGFAFAHGGTEIETSCTPGVCLASGTQLAWNSGAFSGGATPDTGLKRSAAGVVSATNGSSGLGALAGSSVSTGTTPPACTAGTAGFMCNTEGTAFTNVASTAGLYADSTTHEYMAKTNGASGAGMMVRVQPSAINNTAKTAAVTTATLCAASAGSCNTAGQYRLTYDVWGSGTACATVTAGSVVLTFTWTDENAVTHTTINAPMWDQKTSAMTAGQVNFNTALGTEGGSGSFIISTNGTIIQYATTYTACTSGTGTYNVRIAVERLQ